MARVTITIDDAPDNGVCIVSDPPAMTLKDRALDPERAPISPAEGVALIALAEILTAVNASNAAGVDSPLRLVP